MLLTPLMSICQSLRAGGPVALHENIPVGNTWLNRFSEKEIFVQPMTFSNPWDRHFVLPKSAILNIEGEMNTSLAANSRASIFFDRKSGGALKGIEMVSHKSRWQISCAFKIKFEEDADGNDLIAKVRRPDPAQD